MTTLRRLPELLLATVLALLIGTAGAQDLVAVPPLAARVVDLAGMVDASQRAGNFTTAPSRGWPN